MKLALRKRGVAGLTKNRNSYLVIQPVYYRYAENIRKQYGKAVSMMRLGVHVTNHLATIICLSAQQFTKQTGSCTLLLRKKKRQDKYERFN